MMECNHDVRYSTNEGEICSNCNILIYQEYLDTSASPSNSRSSQRESRLRQFLEQELHEPIIYIDKIIDRFNKIITERGSRSMKRPMSHTVILVLVYMLHREMGEIYPLRNAMNKLSITTADLSIAMRKVSEVYDSKYLPSLTAVDYVETLLPIMNLSKSAIKPLTIIYNYLVDDAPSLVVNTEMKTVALGLLYYYMTTALKSKLTKREFLENCNAVISTQIMHVVKQLKKLQIDFYR